MRILSSAVCSRPLGGLSSLRACRVYRFERWRLVRSTKCRVYLADWKATHVWLHLSFPTMIRSKHRGSMGTALDNRGLTVLAPAGSLDTTFGFWLWLLLMTLKQQKRRHFPFVFISFYFSVLVLLQPPFHSAHATCTIHLL